MPPKESKKRSFFLGVQGRLALIIVVAMLALALFGEKGVLRAYKLSREKHMLEEELKGLKADNEALRREIDLLRNDADYLEDLARRELGMVKDDELVYQFSPESPPSPPEREKPDEKRRDPVKSRY